MQKEKFQEYLYNTESYKNAALSELAELTLEYPWFSTAGIILLVCSKMQSDPNFDSLLKKHSINTTNRKYLIKLLQFGIGDTIQKNLILTNKTASRQLQSRIPGMFDFPEKATTTNGILTETHNNSVLEDDSLLEFAYSPRESDSSNSERNKAEITGREEILSLSLHQDEDFKVSSDEEEQNFDHWISKLAEVSVAEQSPHKKHLIIKSFMDSDPGVIRADKETQLLGDVSKSSAEENEGFITDTLAKIYIKQGLYNKAIYAYEKLCLKYPEKSIYFASQIEEIKRLYIKK